MPDKPKPAVRRVNLWAALAGFGMAGLADGLVLHRLLGWHHLLSSAAPEAALDWHLRADSLFDAIMFVALGVSLAGAMFDRAALSRIQPRCVAGMTLYGFGLWHMLDAVVVHWLLGLHRIRPEAESPLLWDIGWLFIFGLLPVIIGFSMRDTTDVRSERQG